MHQNLASTRPCELTLNSYNYENPQDTDGNNTYEVTLSVTDPAGLSASKPVGISDRPERGSAHLAMGKIPF